MILLSETHTTTDIDDNELLLNNYNVIRLDSSSKYTGGVGIYINNIWQFEIIQQYTIGLNIWWLAIKCVYENMSFIAVIVYRSPNSNSSKRQFCNFFKEWVEAIEDLNMDIFIVGDFNINWTENDIYKKEIENTITDNGLIQKVSEFTRITQYSETLIDYLITNSSKLTYAVNKGLKISDHETIEFEISYRNSKLENNKKVIEVFNYNQEKFDKELTKCGITDINKIECINESANQLNNKLNYVINKFKIKKTINSNGTKEWYNSDLRNMKNYKIRLYERASLSKSEADWVEYRTIRNKYKVMLERNKNVYIQSQISKATNQKQMWRVIKREVLKESKAEIKKVKFDNEVLSNNRVIVTKLNDYFIDSVTKINKSIPNVIYEDYIEEVNCKLKFNEITNTNLKEICMKMNNKKDYKGVNAKILLDNWSQFGEILKNLFNKSMCSGKFPQSWKGSLVVPIQKVKNTIKSEELRPVNMLSTMEKLFEKVVKVQVEKYFENNNIIIKEQSGFRKSHTCESALNWTIIEWKEHIENRKVICAVFLDFKRAFETLDRRVLLKK